MNGDGQLRAFIERILRLKEEQDTLAADIRDVYAEAKGCGLDKTAMGQLVAHLRKVEKVGVAAVEEGQSIFDLYLAAYERADAPSHAHTREGKSYAEAKGREKVSAAHHLSTTHKASNSKASSAETGDLVTTPSETGEITEQPETATSSQRPSVSNPPDQSWEVSSAENDSEKISAPVPPSPVAAQDQQAKAGEAPTGASSAPHSEDDDFDPSKLTFLKSEQREDEKLDCLKLKDGHCRLSFRTSALCAECNAARMKARVAA